MKPKLRWRVSRQQAGMGLLQFLRDSCPEAPSVKAIKRAIDGKRCTVNGRIETFSSYSLAEEDLVVLKEGCFAAEEKGKELRATTLYEDEHLLVVNKPAGLVSDEKSAFKGLHLVHRLDKETSGALILAKTPEAKTKMLKLFKERSVRKMYLALVDGVPSKKEGTIDNFLTARSRYEGQTIYGVAEAHKGLRAITHWTCLSHSKVASVLSCEPHTGRTHQLRVHLSSMGHPILGDSQYGKRFVCTLQPVRNLLHAYRVSFSHPITGQPIKVVAPIPTDFKQALKVLKISL